MRKIHVPAVAALLAHCLGSSGWSAEQSFGWGKQELSLTLGYAQTIPVGEVIENVGYLYAAPRWGIGVTNPLGGNSWYRGNFELVAEGAYLREFTPEQGNAGGGALLVRYNFLRGEKFVPFIETGAGILSLSFHLRKQKDGKNYTGQGGFGFHYFLSNQTAFTGQWRFHHISNGRFVRNHGINTGVILVGLSYFLN